MTCRADQCTQGRKPCPCPEECSDEPLTDPAYMLTLAAVWGVVAVAVIVGAIGWLVTAVWPVLAPYINR